MMNSYRPGQIGLGLEDGHLCWVGALGQGIMGGVKILVPVGSLGCAKVCILNMS